MTINFNRFVVFCAAIAGLILLMGSGCLAVVPKTIQFDPATYKGETGKITLSSVCEVSLYMQKIENGEPGDYLTLDGKTKSLACPIGNYKLIAFFMTLTGKDGRAWFVSRRNVPGDDAQMLEVKSGGNIDLDIASGFAASIEAGKIGKISLPYAGECSVQLSSVNDGKFGFSLSISSKDKTLLVPEGNYQVNSYSVTMKEENGSGWRIASPDMSGKDAKIIKVKPNAEVKLASGSQLASSIKNGKIGNITLPCEGQSSLSLCILDGKKSGESIDVKGNSRALAVPEGNYRLNGCSLELVDKNGQKWSINNGNVPIKLNTLVVKSGGNISLGDASQFAASIKDGKTGTISLPYKGSGSMQLRLMDNGKPGFSLFASSKDSAIVLPSAKYQVVSYTVMSTDRNENRVDIRSGPLDDSNARIVDVKPDEELKLACGGQLASSLRDGEIGEIEFPFEGKSTVFLTDVTSGKEGNAFSLTPKERTLPVPSGKYRLVRYFATMNDKNGVECLVSINAASGKTAPIVVVSGAKTVLSCSDTLEASVVVKQDGDKVDMSLKMLAPDGYSYAFRSSDTKVAPPGFEVLSKTGEMLMSANFAYG